jgi:hypothetical protein
MKHLKQAQHEDDMKHALPRKVKTGANVRSKTRLKKAQKPPAKAKKSRKTSKSRGEKSPKKGAKSSSKSRPKIEGKYLVKNRRKTQ